MHGPLLLLSQPLRRMEFSLAAQPFKPPGAPGDYPNHALFAFKALTGSQIISGPDQTTLRLFHFQRAAQLTRINLPTPTAQCFSHQFVIAHNGIAFKEMFLRKLKWRSRRAACAASGKQTCSGPTAWVRIERLTLPPFFSYSKVRYSVSVGFQGGEIRRGGGQQFLDVLVKLQWVVFDG